MPMRRPQAGRPRLDHELAPATPPAGVPSPGRNAAELDAASPRTDADDAHTAPPAALPCADEHTACGGAGGLLQAPDDAAGTTPEDAPSAESAAPLPPPEPIHVETHLDAAGSSRARLTPAEIALLEAVREKIGAGKLALPKLPSTHATLLHLTGGEDISTKLVVETVERDPMLAAEVLKAANSAMHAAAEPARTVAAAVIRLGARNLRTLLWSLTVKATAPEDGDFSAYALESWRQSAAMARMARVFAAQVGQPPEQVYTAVLLADVGKVALLATLRREVERARSPVVPGPALIGCLFREEHEAAGAALARNWRLPDEVAANCARHHDWQANEEGLKLAALTSLVQRLDMLLSLGALVAFQSCTRRPEFAALGVPFPQRAALLAAAEEAWRRQDAG